MDKEFAKRIIQEAFEEGVREIGFYLIGEPFVYQALDEVISFSKRIGFSYIYITTNGVLATPEKMIKVMEAGLDSIKFSINAGTCESYKKIHGEDDFLKVKENLEWLRAYLDETGFPLKTFISFAKCNYNKDEIPLFHEQFDKLVDKVYVTGCYNQGGNSRDLIKTGVVDELLHGEVPCDMLFNRLHVTVEVFLDACCGDSNGQLAVADLHNTSLKDAWIYDAMVDLRRQHISGEIKHPLCKRCVHGAN